jgi:diguanylate cyclase (GGDEF)-like protein
MKAALHATPTAAANDQAAPEPAMPAWWVPARVREAEPWLLAAAALAAAAGAAAWAPLDARAWLLALAAGTTAACARRWPAARPQDLAGRAGMLLASGGCLLLPALPGAVATALPTWAFAAWLAAACGVAALLLPGGWSFGVLVAAALAMASAGTVPEPAVAAALGAPVLAALLAGGWLRRRDAQRESAHVDGMTGLYNLAGLAEQGDRCLAACRRAQRPAAMAVFDCSDLLEVRRVYGSRAGRALLLLVLQRLQAIAGSRGMVARTGPVEFTVLLPGADQARLGRAIEQVLGLPSRIEYDEHDSEIVVVPNHAVAACSDAAPATAELHGLLSTRLAGERAGERRRQDWLRRERERHTRPAVLAA